MIRFAIRMVLVPALTVATSLTCGGGGCTAPRPKLVVTDPDPSVKIPAIKIAGERKDLAATPQLVEDLDSDDPAVRLYAINGLRRITGEDFGYRYYDDPDARAPAVAQWREWLAKQQQQRPHEEGAGR